jgi:uncharacterized protein (TIGR00251 family)
MARKIWVNVKPHAKKETMTQISDTEWQVSVQALPEKGDANKAIIKLLARHFSVPQSAIKILRGSFARKKLIQLG